MLFVDEAWQLPHHLFDKVDERSRRSSVGVGDVGQLPPLEIGTNPWRGDPGYNPYRAWPTDYDGDARTWSAELPAVWRPAAEQLALWRAFYPEWGELDCVAAPGDRSLAPRTRDRRRRGGLGAGRDRRPDAARGRRARRARGARRRPAADRRSSRSCSTSCSPPGFALEQARYDDAGSPDRRRRAPSPGRRRRATRSSAVLATRNQAVDDATDAVERLREKHGLTEHGPARVDRRLLAGPDERDHRRDPPADRRVAARRVQLGVRPPGRDLHPRHPRAARGVAPRPRRAAGRGAGAARARRSASRATGSCRARPTSASSPRSPAAPLPSPPTATKETPLSRLNDLHPPSRPRTTSRWRRICSARSPRSPTGASFGLNFERHVPEAVELPGRPVRTGDKVRILPPRGETPTKADERLWRVVAVDHGRRRRGRRARRARRRRTRQPTAARRRPGRRRRVPRPDLPRPRLDRQGRARRRQAVPHGHQRRELPRAPDAALHAPRQGRLHLHRPAVQHRREGLEVQQRLRRGRRPLPPLQVAGVHGAPAAAREGAAQPGRLGPDRHDRREGVPAAGPAAGADVSRTRSIQMVYDRDQPDGRRSSQRVLASRRVHASS